jgi:hypothetical protein
MLLTNFPDPGSAKRNGEITRMIGNHGLLLTIVAMLAIPSFASSESLTDHELDQITAAGEPVIVSGGNNSPVTFTPATDIDMYVGPFAQAGLRALVLNNVSGENQVANGANISSQSPLQSNTLNQNWGSVQDTTAVVIPGVGATAVTTCPASALICTPSSTAVTVPAVTRVLSNTADQIITAGNGSAVLYSPATNIAMRLDSNSQSNLVALVVNNVSGLNQVGNAINIHGGVRLDDSIGVSSVTGQAGGQQNILTQYRGTPANVRQ